MSNNTNRVQSIFIADGTAMPATNGTIAALTPGKIGIYGQNMLALNPGGTDTITTQPYIYIMESKTDSNGVNYLKRSGRIDGANITSYTSKKYNALKREVYSIGYNRLTTVGAIEVNPNTDYTFSIAFKYDKRLYSERPETLRITFTSSTVATQLSIANQIALAINNSAQKAQVIALVVGNGTGVSGLTGATFFGVEITSKDINQNLFTSYTPMHVYFSVHVLDASGFGTTTTCTEIQALQYGTGTYNQVFTMENFDLASEGVLNRRQWPIPAFDYSSLSTLLSGTTGITSNAITGEDKVLFSAPVTGILAGGDKVSIDGILYEIKYLTDSTHAILTTPLLSTNVAGVVLVRVKYTLINIEYNDAIFTPTGVVAIANKSIVIAVPAITAGGAYTTKSQSGTDVKAVLDAWMFTTPRAFAAITI